MDQSGSYSDVGHTKKDLQNRFEQVRRSEVQTSDADSVISSLITLWEKMTNSATCFGLIRCHGQTMPFSVM